MWFMFYFTLQLNILLTKVKKFFFICLNKICFVLQIFEFLVISKFYGTFLINNLIINNG